MNLRMKTVMRPIVSLSRALLASVILLATVALGVGGPASTAGVPVGDRTSNQAVRSVAMVVSSPWPVWTTVSGGRVKSRVRIDVTMVS